MSLVPVSLLCSRYGYADAGTKVWVCGVLVLMVGE